MSFSLGAAGPLFPLRAVQRLGLRAAPRRRINGAWPRVFSRRAVLRCFAFISRSRADCDRQRSALLNADGLSRCRIFRSALPRPRKSVRIFPKMVHIVRAEPSFPLGSGEGVRITRSNRDKITNGSEDTCRSRNSPTSSKCA